MDALSMLVIIALMAFICEYIDSSLGMGYGTVLSPALIIMGFDPLAVVPAVLFSQAMGGFVAAAFHHRFLNVNFGPRTRDSKIVYVITAFGMAATIIAALVAVNIPKELLRTYIGLVILAMGIIILLKRKFRFSWKKIIGLGVLSAFISGSPGPCRASSVRSPWLNI